MPELFSVCACEDIRATVWLNGPYYYDFCCLYDLLAKNGHIMVIFCLKSCILSILESTQLHLVSQILVSSQTGSEDNT